MYEVLFITATGARRLVTGFPLLGGCLFAAAELLSPGQRSEVFDQLTGYTIRFRSDGIGTPDYPHPCGPQPAVSVQITDADGDLVFDFNADSGEEAGQWARRVLGLAG